MERLENNSYIQEKFHVFILFTCITLIPFMFIPKPILIYYNNKKSKIDKIPQYDKLSDEIELVK